MAEEAIAIAGAGGSSGGEEVGAASGGSSPKSRMKFLCSYGGKILPRPADGHLKYVGGETRVIGVPRDINVSELMKKLKSEFEGDMVLKYQVMPEELDVLISVRTDEDLKHMLEEYDRHETGGTSKLRTFLFPSTPVMAENQNGSADPHAIEQRYIDAINNTVRSSSNFRPPPPINANRPIFSLSASSSPKADSPEGNTIDTMPHEHNFVTSYHSTRFPMHKVHSSPSLYNLNASSHHQSNNHGNHHHYYQPHHHHHQHHQQHHPPSYQSSSRLHHESNRLSPSLSLGRPDFGRAPISHLNQYHPNVHNAGSSNVHSNWNSGGNSNRYGYYDIEQHSAYGCRTIERLDSLPPSPKHKVMD